jgi:hypothetical protein
LDDIVYALEEMHKISKNKARIKIITCHYSSSTSYRDPTHRYHLSLNSFDYFDKDCTKHQKLTDKKFSLVKKEILFNKSLKAKLQKYIISLIGTENYEHRFSWLFPINSPLYFELEVLKD